MNFADGLNLNSQLKNIEVENIYARLANEYGVDDINSMNGETPNETNLFIYAAVERVTHISNCITCLNILFRYACVDTHTHTHKQLTAHTHTEAIDLYATLHFIPQC